MADTLDLGLEVPRLLCISLWQPWAAFVAEGDKTAETRSWPTPYRGLLGIHAAKKRGGFLSGRYGPWVYDGLANVMWRAERDGTLEQPDRYQRVPLGALVSIVELVDCVPVERLEWHAHVAGWTRDADGKVTVGELERPFGDYSPGRYAWLLRHVRAVDPPMVVNGHQGFFSVNLKDVG